MKRDMDLVRAILLAVEEGTLKFDDTKTEFGPFKEIVRPHLLLMEEAGLLNVQAKMLRGDIRLVGLTWEGHDLADAIRDPEVWRRTKEGASKMGGWTVDLLKEAAKAYLKHVAKERLGLDL